MYEKQEMKKYLYDFEQLYKPLNLQHSQKGKTRFLLQKSSELHQQAIRGGLQKINKLERQKESRRRTVQEEQVLLNRLNYLKKQNEKQWRSIKKAGFEALKYISYAKEKEQKQLRSDEIKRSQQFKLSVIQERKNIRRREKLQQQQQLASVYKLKNMSYHWTKKQRDIHEQIVKVEKQQVEEEKRQCALKLKKSKVEGRKKIQNNKMQKMLRYDLQMDQLMKNEKLRQLKHNNLIRQYERKEKMLLQRLENTSVVRQKALKSLQGILKFPTSTIHQKYDQLNKSISQKFINSDYNSLLCNINSMNILSKNKGRRHSNRMILRNKSKVKKFTGLESPLLPKHKEYQKLNGSSIYKSYKDPIPVFKNKKKRSDKKTIKKRMKQPKVSAIRENNTSPALFKKLDGDVVLNGDLEDSVIQDLEKDMTLEGK